MRIRLKIDNVDRSANLLQESWEISKHAFGGIDTFSFILDDPTKALTLTCLKDVIVEDFADADPAKRQFGGLLTKISQSSLAVGRRFHCEALGWVFDLGRAEVRDIYRGASDQEVILNPTATATKPKGIFLNTEKDLTSYTVTTANIKEGRSNTNKLVFNGDTVRDIMDMLADWVGFVWGVTPGKVVYYRPIGEASHAFTLSDAPDLVISFGHRAFRRDRDCTKLANAITVYGGRILEKDQTKIYSGDGVKTLHHLGLAWRARDNATVRNKIDVERNTGTDGTPVWTVQTVGYPQEPGTFQVLWDELADSLEWTTAPPNFSNSFRIQGDVLRPLIGEAVDQASIDDIGRFHMTVKDPSLTDDDSVERRADIELKKYADEYERITCLTTKDGIEPGKLITVVNAIHGVNANYLVAQVVMRGVGGALQEYDLTLTRWVG